MSRPRDARASPEGRLLAGLIALKVDPAVADPLLKYLGELVLWNKAYNLTAVRDPAEMVTRHILDSLTVLPFVRESLVDVGSGAGLPGLVVAIARPDLPVVVLDSNGKKARFLRHVQRQLSLPNVAVADSRAEAFRPQERFGTVISRAFGSLGAFLKATGHMDAGQWLAMKGKLDPRETGDPAPGFEIRSEPLKVPGLDEERHLLIATRTA